MSPQNDDQNIKLIDRFSLVEKILMRIGFYGFIIVGVYGIFTVSTLWGAIYIGFILLSLSFGLLYCLCSHCPYPYQFSTCLFLPYGIVKKICRFRSESMNILEKIVFMVAILGLVVFPQYWLFKNYTILIIFWIFCLPTLGGLLFYFCKRCRHSCCPFNSARKKTGEGT
ncbi:MAG: hypothetical protein JXB26_14365 [Candidatus Aminicenantes bacterium]|nr:hypothetical protein [Candidatus Aminicenantes bacterium]